MLAPRRQTYITRSAVTVAAGGVSFGLTNVLVSGVFEQLALSIFVGGFFLVVQLLSDIEHRLHDASQRVEDSAAKYAVLEHEVEIRADELRTEVRTEIRTGFDRFDRATKLLAHIMETGFQPDALIDLVRRVAELPASTPPLLLTFLRGEVERLASLLKGIGVGTVEYEGEDPVGLLGFTRSAAATIDAISLPAVDTLEFWRSELGVRYLLLQREAIERGVGVRRVFISDGVPHSLHGDLLYLFDIHAGLGIEVRVLMPDRVPGTMRRDLRDFIVFDGTLSFESTPGHPVDSIDGVIQSTRYMFDSDHVNRRQDNFEELWAAAAPLAEIPRPAAAPVTELFSNSDGMRNHG